MSNNKQTMKLYTEEEIKRLLQKRIIFDDDDLDELTPIKLPSDSLCINCDESESTHNICMNCIIKIGKENIQLPSNEEVDEQAEHEDTYSKKSLLQEAQNGCGTEHLDATMSNNKESSIMWLYEKMFVNHGRITIEEFEQAKAMHKEEITDALIDGSMNSTLIEYRIPQYYNETFGGNNEQ